MPSCRLLVLFVDQLQYRLPDQVHWLVAELSRSKLVDREHRAGSSYGEIHRRIVVVECTIACLALLERGLPALALGNINVYADDTYRAPVAVVRNQATRLDPPRPTVWANNPVLRVMLTASRRESLAAERIQARKVIRMHTGSPLVAGKLFSSLGQAVYDRVAR